MKKKYEASESEIIYYPVFVLGGVIAASDENLEGLDLPFEEFD